MTDRELLELAAKAAGYVPQGMEQGLMYLFGVQNGWNPLIDDGDALRLANKLGLILVVSRPNIKHRSTIARRENEGRGIEIMHGQDPDSATRRAIVRAAADIGRPA
jgi:hypothetical protein